MYEIKVNQAWVEVAEYIFRSWTGERRIDGATHHGEVYVLGTGDRCDSTQARACSCGVCR